MLGFINPEEQNVVIDSQSKFGQKRLITIPNNNSLRLSDQEVSYGLHIRTLCPGLGTKCGNAPLRYHGTRRGLQLESELVGVKQVE